MVPVSRYRRFKKRKKLTDREKLSMAYKAIVMHEKQADIDREFRVT